MNWNGSTTLGLTGLGIGRDTVVCPSFTFAASANPICYRGAEPVFVDSEPHTWNMDPALLEQALAEQPQVKAVIVVHLYGQCAQMDAITDCATVGVALIEDAAEALGATYRQPAGSFGELSFVSFNGNKIITTSGGGTLLTDNPAGPIVHSTWRLRRGNRCCIMNTGRLATIIA